MEIKRNRVVFLLVLAMVVQVFAPAGMGIAHGEEVGSQENSMEIEGLETTSASAIEVEEGGKDLGNIFTFAYLKINDKDIEDGEILEIDEGTLVHLGLTWDTIGFGAQPGDTASIEISDVFEDVTITNQPILVEGVNVGEYSIMDGVLNFVFNNEIIRDEVQKGFVDLGLKFKLEKFQKDIEQKIPFNDSKNTTLNVVAKPIGSISGIEKEGHPDASTDAREITWTIDIINTNDEAVSGASVSDVVPEGLEMKSGSFEFRELVIGIDGESKAGDQVPFEAEVKGQDFSIEFGDIGAFKGYRIQYTTTILDFSKDASFTNSATFKYGETELPAESTVSGLERSNPIEKDGKQVGTTDVIQWTIDVNKNGMSIDDAKVVDDLPEGLSIVDGSIEVVKIEKSGETWIEKEPHGGTFEAFPMELGSLGENDAYRIRFETSVDWSEVNEGEYLKSNGFLNTAILYDGGSELNDDDATVTIVRDPILQKVGESNVDYDNKTITWKVTVNKEKHPLGQVTVTDYIPVGLVLEGDVSIKTDGSHDYSSVSPSIETVDSGDQAGKTKLEIILESVGTQTITIEYTTRITDFAINRFTNSVGMTGTGVGEGGDGRYVNVNPAANTYAKGFKGIDYKEKTINWELRVNPKREAISELGIEDTFPNKGMILLPETVLIKLGTETLAEGTHYTLQPREEGEETGYHKGFVITFNEGDLPIDGGVLVITYQTSYDSQLEVGGNKPEPHIGGEGNDKVYLNKAHFTGKTVNANSIDIEREASTKVRDDSWNSGKKEGQLISTDSEGKIIKENGWTSGFERKLAWQMYFNYQKQNLGTGVSVTDTLEYEGEIEEGSIRVSIYEVKSDGHTEISGPELGSDNYTLTVDGKTFTLTFKDDFVVDERYVVEYVTSVPDISEETYTNKAIVKVGDKEYPYSATMNYSNHNKFLEKGAANLEGKEVFTGDEVNWEVIVNEGLSIIDEPVITDTISDGLVYLNDSLSISRLEGTDWLELTEGEDYSLDEGSNILTITLTETLRDSLRLQYKTAVTATTGSVSNKIELEGSVLEKKTVESQEISARLFSSVGGEWAPSRGALKIFKVDAEENLLIEDNEATFELWYLLNGKKVQFGGETFETDNGVLEIGNLPLRTYYIKEVVAPNGYVLSDNEMEIEVDKAYAGNLENIFEVEFGNIKEKIYTTATKVWVDGDNRRPESIKLQLYRDGEEYGEPVTVTGAGDEWTYTWEELDKTDIDGVDHVYTADEVEIPINYTKIISEDGLTITNTYGIPEEGTVEASKVWIGGPSDKPTIWFRLYRRIEGGNPELVPGVEIQELVNGKEKASWTDLEETDIEGNTYIFSVKEVDEDGNDFVPERYGKSEDGLTVTNRYRSPSRPRPEEPEEPEEPKTPEEPVDQIEPEDTEEPTNPTDNSTPTNPGESENPNNPEKPEEDELGEGTPGGGTDVDENPATLPKTGDSTNKGIMIVGVVLMTIGFLLRIKQIKRKSSI